MSLSGRLVSLAFLLSLYLLPAAFGNALAETQGSQEGGQEGVNDGFNDADGGQVIPADEFLQRAYRVEELQTEYHNNYKLVRCKSFLFFFLFPFFSLQKWD